MTETWFDRASAPFSRPRILRRRLTTPLSLSTVFVLYAGLLPLPPHIPPLAPLFSSNIHNLRMQRFSLPSSHTIRIFLNPDCCCCCCCFCCSSLLLFHLPHLYRVVLHFFAVVVALPPCTPHNNRPLLLLHHSSQRVFTLPPHSHTFQRNSAPPSNLHPNSAKLQ